MINFKTIDVKFFGIEIDGLSLRTYPKIYQAKITSADRVILYNTKTEKELYNSLRFNEFSVNGVVSTDANAAQVLLNALTFNDGTGGVDFQPQIDSLQTQINDLADLDLISGSVVANNLILTLNDGSTVTIDATAFTADVRVTSGVYNPTTKALDFTLSNSTTISVPVSALLLVTHDASLSGDGSTSPLSVVKTPRANVICRGKLIQSLVNNNWTTLVNWTEVLDQTNSFTPSTGIFVAPRDGIYHFSLGNGLNILANQYYGLSVLKSGLQLYNDVRYSGIAGVYYISISASIEMTAGQTLTPRMFKGGPVANDVIGIGSSWFTIMEINNNF